MNVKSFAIAAGAAVVGNLLAEKFVLKPGPDSPGLVAVTPMSFGADDVARGVTIAATMWAAKKFLGGR